MISGDEHQVHAAGQRQVALAGAQALHGEVDGDERRRARRVERDARALQPEQVGEPARGDAVGDARRVVGVEPVEPGGLAAAPGRSRPRSCRRTRRCGCRPSRSGAMPACSSASHATSSSRRCCGSMLAASRGAMPKNCGVEAGDVARGSRRGGWTSCRARRDRGRSRPSMSQRSGGHLGDGVDAVAQQRPRTRRGCRRRRAAGSRCPTMAIGSRRARSAASSLACSWSMREEAPASAARARRSSGSWARSRRSWFDLRQLARAASPRPRRRTARPRRAASSAGRASGRASAPGSTAGPTAPRAAEHALEVGGDGGDRRVVEHQRGRQLALERRGPGAARCAARRPSASRSRGRAAAGRAAARPGRRRAARGRRPGARRRPATSWRSSGSASASAAAHVAGRRATTAVRRAAAPCPTSSSAARPALATASSPAARATSTWWQQRRRRRVGGREGGDVAEAGRVQRLGPAVGTSISGTSARQSSSKRCQPSIRPVVMSNQRGCSVPS